MNIELVSLHPAAQQQNEGGEPVKICVNLWLTIKTLFSFDLSFSYFMYKRTLYIYGQADRKAAEILRQPGDFL